MKKNKLRKKVFKYNIYIYYKMTQNCYRCNNYFADIPLLRCNHALCSVCYCKQKDQKLDNCFLCNKKLIRGKKKNK